MEKRIIIAGSGGQGVLFFGKLLAYAAMLEGREVTWFPSYGAEMRGGTANCTVIISDSMIGSPVIGNPDVLVVMNDDSYRRFVEKLSPGGILIYDSSQIRSATPRGRHQARRDRRRRHRFIHEQCEPREHGLDGCVHRCYRHRRY